MPFRRVGEQRRVLYQDLLNYIKESQKTVHPDAFLVELLDAIPDAFLAALRNHRAALQNPSRTPEEYLARFVDTRVLRANPVSPYGLRKTAA